jgi:hypothetical protein
MRDSRYASWPELSYPAWRETGATLHLWTQIVGKIRLAHTPWLNHSWHVPLYVTARGLTTSAIDDGQRSFELQFDFTRHELEIAVSDGARRHIPLRPQSVAAFYGAVMSVMAELEIEALIRELPCEIAGAVPFSADVTHATYDPEQAERFFGALRSADRVLKRFRTGFIGKSSPVHFFWGSFDLAVTRFSGRRAPPFSGSVPGVPPAVMREAYSHEVSSAGFWTGGTGAEYPTFYSYAYPPPPAYRQSAVRPREAVFNEALGEFLLPYELVRRAPDPEGTLLTFLQSTYEAAAETARWDRASLECPLGIPGVPLDSAARAQADEKR